MRNTDDTSITILQSGFTPNPPSHSASPCPRVSDSNYLIYKCDKCGNLPVNVLPTFTFHTMDQQVSPDSLVRVGGYFTKTKTKTKAFVSQSSIWNRVCCEAAPGVYYNMCLRFRFRGPTCGTVIFTNPNTKNRMCHALQAVTI